MPLRNHGLDWRLWAKGGEYRVHLADRTFASIIQQAIVSTVSDVSEQQLMQEMDAVQKIGGSAQPGSHLLD